MSIHDTPCFALLERPSGGYGRVIWQLGQGYAAEEVRWISSAIGCGRFGGVEHVTVIEDYSGLCF